MNCIDNIKEIPVYEINHLNDHQFKVDAVSDEKVWKKSNVLLKYTLNL